MAQTIFKVNGKRVWAAQAPGAGRSIPQRDQDELSYLPSRLSITLHVPPCSLRIPSGSAGRMGQPQHNCYSIFFPFILAGADESGRNPSASALPHLLPLPKAICGLATDVRNFRLHGRCETWQFCSLRGELQPLQHANKQTNAN